MHERAAIYIILILSYKSFNASLVFGPTAPDPVVGGCRKKLHRTSPSGSLPCPTGALTGRDSAWRLRRWRHTPGAFPPEVTAASCGRRARRPNPQGMVRPHGRPSLQERRVPETLGRILEPIDAADCRPYAWWRWIESPQIFRERLFAKRSSAVAVPYRRCACTGSPWDARNLTC